MNKTRWVLFTGLAVMLLGGGYLILSWMNRPMGQALTLQTPTQVIKQPDSTPFVTVVKEAPTAVATVPSATETLQPTDVPKICGNTGSMNLLVIAMTLPTEGEFLEADAIRRVTINFDQPSATILAIPPSLWGETPVLADLAVEENWLRAVYEETYLRVQSDSEEFRNQVATQAIAQTLLDNFGFVTDHFITLDEIVFIDSVDKLGGVEVNLPEAVDSSLEGYGHYRAGLQTLDGRRALNLARLFYPDSEDDLDVWGNMGRQNLVMRGILAATLKPKNWTKMPSLINEVQQKVLTDLSPNQILDLACMAYLVGENTRILGVSDVMVSRDETGRMIPDLEAIKGLIAQMDRSD